MWRCFSRASFVHPASFVVASHVVPSLACRHHRDDLSLLLQPLQHTTHRVGITHRVVSCAPKAHLLQCTACDQRLCRGSFAADQQRRSTRICKHCAATHVLASRSAATILQCDVCENLLPRDSFAVRQQQRSTKICRFCAGANSGGRPEHSMARIDLGTLSQRCEHCTASLFPSEGTTFCCGRGMHFVDFKTYHRPPGDDFLKLFAATWTYLDAKGNPVHDDRIGAPRLTGFSAMSRRYNNLFTLAVHEIHSTTSERELRFGNELRPSNVRIHGTMYRRIWTCADNTPLRYLVFDPKERAAQGKLQHVDLKVLKKLERLLLPRNGYVQVLQRLAATTNRAPTVAMELRWDEGINELAAIAHTSTPSTASSRSVLFRKHNSGQLQYLNPLSALYEPLSYPLWFPYGGRGWSTDVLSPAGHPVSQMWWYRQLLLRMSYMHMCGRLLNEWLVNMYCRMEDERLAASRREQTHRSATRGQMCEAVANETPVLGISTFLPSSIPGSPRHLRRLRMDALELARRKGPPTFFITLTCNPYWPEILACLHDGQTAADRPDIVVRVFHARLEAMMAYLKQHYCGPKRYVVRVIEYQRRGLPHAHIAIALSTPPCTPEDVDAYISCELPSEGPVRDLVLQHMIHCCNHSCHPDDPSQECVKGCPWPLVDDTYFDERGYPHHRRRQCGGTCPNCTSRAPVYGKRHVCCNRLIVEYSAPILIRWDGHANVKFAGSVNLFQYLYKYLFKGPDFVKYDIQDVGSAPKDEIKEWQLGRYLCATECAWRIFGQCYAWPRSLTYETLETFQDL